MERPRISSDKIAPNIAPRVQRLLRDLSEDDLSLALQDLIQLRQALATPQTYDPAEENGPSRPPVLQYGEDGERLAGVCYGPKASGACPRVGRNGELPCAQQWLVRWGWMFKVAPDVDVCPLVSLGFAPPSAGSSLAV
jgi:hypothetical protein